MMNGEKVDVDGLAERQAERLAKKIEEQRASAPAQDAAAPAAEQPAAAPQAEAAAQAVEPKVVGEMSVRIYDNGMANIVGPIENPGAMGDLLRAVFVTYVQHREQVAGQAAVDALVKRMKSEVPPKSFMGRMLDRVRTGRGAKGELRRGGAPCP